MAGAGHELKRAVFLDRDGIINAPVVRNGKPYPPSTLDSVEILPGVKDALIELKEAGFLNIVATNQPDVATGKQSRAIVDAIHEKMKSELALDDIRVCFCVEGPDCPCYKPSPGLLIEAAKDWGVDLSKSFMIGDRWRDVGAGQSAGCITFFVDYQYKEDLIYRPDFTISGLPEAVELIIAGDAGAPFQKAIKNQKL